MKLRGESVAEYMAYARPFRAWQEKSLDGSSCIYVVRDAEGVGLAACDEREAAEVVVAALNQFQAAPDTDDEKGE